MATIDQTTNIVPVTAATPVAPLPSASQQSAFGSAMAAAELGMTTDGTPVDTPSGSDAKSAQHLALFSMFQQTMLRVMDDVDRNRKEGSDSDE